MLKKILLILVVLVIVAGAGAGFLLSRLDAETLRTKVADMSKEATGKPLYMAKAPSLSLMPLGISLGQASWGYEGGKPAAFGLSLEVKSALVRLELMPLLSGRVVVQEVRLDSPQVSLRPEKPGTEAAPVTTGKTGDKSAPATLPVELERLNISNGALIMQTGPGQNVRVQGLNVAVSNLKPGAEATLKLDMGVSCDNPEVQGNFSLAGHARLDGDTVTLRQTKLSFTPLEGLVPKAVGPVQVAVDGTYALSAGKVQLSALSVTMQGLALEAKGQASVPEQSFAGEVSLNAEPALVGKNMGMALPSAPGMGKLSLKSGLTVGKDAVRVSGLSGQADGISLNADLTLGLGQGQGGVPSVAGKVKLGALDLDALNSKAQAAPAKTPTAKGAKSVQSAAKPADTVYPKVDMEITVAALTVAKVRAENILLKVRGNGGKSTEYVVDPLELRLATGGSFRTTAKASLPAMQYAAAGKVSAVALGPLLQAVNNSRPLNGSADVDYNLTCAGTSAAAIKASLSGRGQITVTNMEVTAMPKLPKPADGVLPSRFERLSVPFTAQKGVVTISNMTLSGQGLNAQGKGVLNLPRENTDMAINVSTLGMQIPVTVKGPLADLSYGVDPKWAAQQTLRVGGAILQGGKSAGGAVVDGGKAAGGKAGSAAEGAGKLVKGLFGR